MIIGLLGFPNTGKSTLFRILTGAPAEPSHPEKTGLRVGVARVPDPRLEDIASIFKPKKVTPATLDFWDPVGFQKPGRKEVLPYQEIRPADAFLHVIRAFEAPSIPPPEGGVNPKRDVVGMESELLLADLGVVEKRLEKLESQLRKAQDPEDEKEHAVLEKVRAGLEKEHPVRRAGLGPDETRKLRGFAFLTDKPILGVINLGEAEVENLSAAPQRYGLEGDPDSLHNDFCAVSAKIEMEVAQLDPSDEETFRRELGLPEPCHERVIRAAYRALGQATFFTYVEGEVKAWSVPAGTHAQQAAGRIHSDMERGFIRAEVIPYKELMEVGSVAAARERGTMRTEGKDYPVSDGDIITFRFHV